MNLAAVGETANDMAILLNSAYATLSDELARRVYADDVRRFRQDSGGAFANIPTSEWGGAEGEYRAVFVDG